MKRLSTFLALLVFTCGQLIPADAPPLSLKTEHFDRDPGWEGRNNRIVPKKPVTVTQDFGSGATRATLDGEAVTLNLKPGHKQEGARRDRFGILSARKGGSMVKIYFDDLTYTAAKP